MGTAIRAKAPLAKGAVLRAPQILSLQAFADHLDAKMLIALNVHKDDLELEGSYWRGSSLRLI